MEILAKSVGRRKEAVAQVQIRKGTGQFIINNKPANEYLQNDACSLISVQAPFDTLVLQTSEPSTNSENKLPSQNFDTIVKVKGGGLMGQSEAIRLGISRALCLLSHSDVAPASADSTVEATTYSLDIRKQLKDKGYLTQDSRVKERRKYGLKKARKASQYHKR